MALLMKNPLFNDHGTLHSLAEAEHDALAEQLVEIEKEMDAKPYLFERIALCPQRELLKQELLSAKIKVANYYSEIKFCEEKKMQKEV